MKFNVGDEVLTPLGPGIIEGLEEDYASVTFTGDLGGGYLPFGFDEITTIEHGKNNNKTGLEVEKC